MFDMSFSMLNDSGDPQSLHSALYRAEVCEICDLLIRVPVSKGAQFMSTRSAIEISKHKNRPFPEHKNHAAKEVPESLWQSFQQVFTDTFQKLCQDLLAEIADRNRLLQLPAYDRNQNIVLLAELAYGAFLHRNHMRKDGSPYFSHIVGALKNILRHNITGLDLLLSALKHDDFEDFSHFREEHLFCEQLYWSFLTPSFQQEFASLQQEVVRIVHGVTKVQNLSQQETKEVTFGMLLETIRDHGLKAAYVKLADRMHNIATLQGHDEQKQKRIAKETMDVYVPLARHLQLPTTQQYFVQGCAKYLNPQLLQDFTQLIAEKKKHYVDPYIQKIQADFPQARLVARSLAQILDTLPTDIPFAELTLEDIKIWKFDPLFEVLILHDSPKGTEIWEQLSAFKYMSKSLGWKKGTSVKIYDATYGRLSFRINSTRDEALSARGLLGEANESTPKWLKEIIIDILGRVDKQRKQGIFQIAAEELFQPRIEIYTPDGDIFHLPKSATPLDVAAQVDASLLIGAQGAEILNRQQHVGPFYPLADQSEVYVISCLNEKDKEHFDPKAVTVDPGWLLCCQSVDAKRIIRQYLQHHEGIGEKFLQKVSTLFGIARKEIEQHMYQKSAYAQKSQAEVFLAIGHGNIDLLEVLEHCPSCINRAQWHFCLQMHNKPAELARLSQELGRHCINIEEIHTEKRGHITNVELVLSIPHVSLYNFLKTILQLYYQGYEFEIIS